MDIKDCVVLLELVLSLMGVIIPLVALFISWRDKKRNILAKQVIAYYCLEDEAIKWIQEILPEAKNIKTTLRTRARENINNIGHVYPDMALREAERYL